MARLEFLLNDELLDVFRCNKTCMSCVDNPQSFLNQLKDHNFVPQEKYEKVSRMKSKERIKKGIYEILDWVEQNRSEDIRLFWKCVFEDFMLNEYPTLRRLHESINIHHDGTFRSAAPSAQKVDKESGDTSEGNQRLENEKSQTSSGKKKRKSASDDGQEEPGLSSHVTPTKKKKATKINFSSMLKSGEEKRERLTWPIYRVQVPVTCGDQEGMLRREKLAEGEKCIFAKEQWFTPNEFEKFAGRERSKNWKLSIRCFGIPLDKLIKEGHLKSARVKRSRGSKKSLSSSPQTITDEEDEDEENSREDEESQPSPDLDLEEEQEDEEPQSTSDKHEDADRHNGGTQKVLNVTCGSLTGKLYKERFATGDCGKSVRTETSWMTPKDFAKEGSGQTDFLWRRDIQCEGTPLSNLIEKQLLRIHSVQCDCNRCKPDKSDLLHQKNDDECWVCKRETDEDLVMCDFCPRSFHQQCHLPHVEDSQLRDQREWKCTFCTFKGSQDCDVFEPVETSRVMSYQMSQYTQECNYLILSLLSADEEKIFATDPSVRLKNYPHFVRKPMWLCKVAEKLRRREYQTVGQFVSDVRLIFSNCAAYHKSDTDARRAVGEKLKQLFERQFTTAFNGHAD